MKQLGNLAIVCAQRKDALLQILGKEVSVHIGEGPQRESIYFDWDDDKKISGIVRELNFGRYARNGGQHSDTDTTKKAAGADRSAQPL